MTDFYAGAREWRFGLEILVPEQEEITAEWVEYCEQAHVLTKQIYRLMSQDEKRKWIRGTAVFVTRGGIDVRSMGAANKFFDALKDRWSNVARLRAIQMRKKAGWLDEDGSNQFLTDPDGNRVIPGGNGQTYGIFSAPSEYYDLGPWDGELTPETKFTV